MKICSKCDEEKLLTEFTRNGDHRWCKSCVRGYDNIRHKEIAVKRRAQKNARQEHIKEWYRDYKSSVYCNRCGVDHPAVIEFHHTAGDKIDCVSNMVVRGFAIKRILEEIQKCEVLCSNCHKYEHWVE